MGIYECLSSKLAVPSWPAILNSRTTMAVLRHPIDAVVNFLYQIYQTIVAYLFSPPPPPAHRSLPNAPRIAVIGAYVHCHEGKEVI